jgi:hypothetical protein
MEDRPMTEFPRRQIGRTGLRVTELGLGCATLGGSQIAVARATAEEIVSAGWAAGVRYVFCFSEIGFGSRAVKLAGSICSPDCPMQRTLSGAHFNISEPGPTADRAF